MIKRLQNKTQYDAVFANRKTIDSKSFKIFWVVNGLDAARLGIAVAKKNIAKAVSRNKFKRIAKESFRLNTATLPAVDVVLIAKKQAAKQSNAEFFVELNSKWQQLNNCVHGKAKS